MMKDVERYYNDHDELYVLISPGYGAGFSTWNCPELAIDGRVIRKFLEHPSVEEFEEFLTSIGYEDVYLGGFDGLTLETVPRGTMFRVSEYDGSEHLDIVSLGKYITA